MGMNTIKGMLTALLLIATPAAMASTLPALDYTVSVGLSGDFETFGGEIFADEAEDNVLVNLLGTGTISAYVTEYIAGAGMALYHYVVGDATPGALVAVASLTGTGAGSAQDFGLSAFLSAGTYLLQINGATGTTYAGSVSAVPLPGAAFLFASALLGAGVAGRKKKLAARKLEAVAA